MLGTFHWRSIPTWKQLLALTCANDTPTFGTSRVLDLKFSTPWSDPTSQFHGRTPTSNTCLNGRQPNCLPTWSKVLSQLTLFQNLQILSTIASGHDVIQTLALFPIWGLLWQLWLLYPLRTSVSCAQCYAPEQRAE